MAEFDHKEFARQMRTNAAKNENGIVLCSPELWEKLASIIENSKEVKHGKWVEWYPPKEYILTGEEALYCCSNCDAKYSDVEGNKFCPYCGATMDGESIST